MSKSFKIRKNCVGHGWHNTAILSRGMGARSELILGRSELARSSLAFLKPFSIMVKVTIMVIIIVGHIVLQGNLSKGEALNRCFLFALFNI